MRIFLDDMRLFGAFHLIWCLIGIPFAVFSAYLLSAVCKKRKKSCKTVVLCVWVIFLVSEFWKQLTLEDYVGASERYWYIPFQLCSMPLYCGLPAALLPRGRAKQAFCCFLCGYSLMGGVLTLAFPQDILIRPLPLALHGFLWHILLIFLGAFLAFSGYGRISADADPVMRGKNDIRKKRILYYADVSAILLIAAGIALSLNLVLWEPSGHTVNLFYLGPMPNTQPVFSQLYRLCGWLPTLFAYLAAVLLGGWLFCLPYLTASRTGAERSALSENTILR